MSTTEPTIEQPCGSPLGPMGENTHSTDNVSESSSWIDVSKSAEPLANTNSNKSNKLEGTQCISDSTEKKDTDTNDTNDANEMDDFESQDKVENAEKVDKASDGGNESDATDNEIENILNAADADNGANIGLNDSNSNSNDSGDYVAIEAEQNETEVEKDIEKALSHKTRGNQFYKLKAFDEAIDEYSRAIQLCPEETEKDCQHLSVFYGNRAACYIALMQYNEALEDCNISLEYNENYIKALWRRAKVSEQLCKYTDASQDYKKILEIDESQTLLVTPHIERLKPKVAEEFEKQKEEVMGKLKGGANWLLGKVGLSLDNFEAKQDPNTGSYNIQFNPNPGNKG